MTYPNKAVEPPAVSIPNVFPCRCEEEVPNWSPCQRRLIVAALDSVLDRKVAADWSVSPGDRHTNAGLMRTCWRLRPLIRSSFLYEIGRGVEPRARDAWRVRREVTIAIQMLSSDKNQAALRTCQPAPSCGVITIMARLKMESAGPRHVALMHKRQRRAREARDI